MTESAQAYLEPSDQLYDEVGRWTRTEMQRSALRLSFLPMATDSWLAAPVPRNTLQTRIAIMRRARRSARPLQAVDNEKGGR